MTLHTLGGHWVVSDYALSLRCDDYRPWGFSLADIAFRSMNIYSTGQIKLLEVFTAEVTHPLHSDDNLAYPETIEILLS